MICVRTIGGRERHYGPCTKKQARECLNDSPQVKFGAKHGTAWFYKDGKKQKIFATIQEIPRQPKMLPFKSFS
jgi:hypothetical protein